MHTCSKKQFAVLILDEYDELESTPTDDQNQSEDNNVTQPPLDDQNQSEDDIVTQPPSNENNQTIDQNSTLLPFLNQNQKSKRFFGYRSFKPNTPRFSMMAASACQVESSMMAEEISRNLDSYYPLLYRSIAIPRTSPE